MPLKKTKRKNYNGHLREKDQHLNMVAYNITKKKNSRVYHQYCHILLLLAYVDIS